MIIIHQPAAVKIKFSSECTILLHRVHRYVKKMRDACRFSKPLNLVPSPSPTICWSTEWLNSNPLLHLQWPAPKRGEVVTDSDAAKGVLCRSTRIWIFLKPKIFPTNRPRMSEQVKWFHVDGSLIPVKKKCGFKNIRIYVDDYVGSSEESRFSCIYKEKIK